VHFSSKVLLNASAAALAIVSGVGCGSGATKPFSAGTTTTVSNVGSGSAANSAPGSSASTVPSASAPAAPASPIPAGATVLASLQSQPGWQTCGGCGNVGGTGQGPDYNLSQGIANPSLSGLATDFYVHGGPAYTGGYYFIEQQTFANPVTYLRY